MEGLTMKENQDRKVVVLGASDKVERYGYKAMEKLLEQGFDAIPVNPEHEVILGRKVFKSLTELTEQIDTLSVYLSAKRSSPLAQAILELAPGRVIFNPGAENPELEQKLDEAGIAWLHACTLVLLSTKRF
ncbi:CoA-binding protein [Treponema sp.]